MHQKKAELWPDVYSNLDLEMNYKQSDRNDTQNKSDPPVTFFLSTKLTRNPIQTIQNHRSQDHLQNTKNGIHTLKES
jgi:hypothetical protein